MNIRNLHIFAYTIIIIIVISLVISLQLNNNNQEIRIEDDSIDLSDDWQFENKILFGYHHKIYIQIQSNFSFEIKILFQEFSVNESQMLLLVDGLTSPYYENTFNNKKDNQLPGGRLIVSLDNNILNNGQKGEIKMFIKIEINEISFFTQFFLDLVLPVLIILIILLFVLNNNKIVKRKDNLNFDQSIYLKSYNLLEVSYKDLIAPYFMAFFRKHIAIGYLVGCFIIFPYYMLDTFNIFIFDFFINVNSFYFLVLNIAILSTMPFMKVSEIQHEWTYPISRKKLFISKTVAYSGILLLFQLISLLIISIVRYNILFHINISFVFLINGIFIIIFVVISQSLIYFSLIIIIKNKISSFGIFILSYIIITSNLNTVFLNVNYIVSIFLLDKFNLLFWNLLMNFSIIVFCLLLSIWKYNNLSIINLNNDM